MYRTTIYIIHPLNSSESILSCQSVSSNSDPHCHNIARSKYLVVSRPEWASNGEREDNLIAPVVLPVAAGENDSGCFYLARRATLPENDEFRIITIEREYGSGAAQVAKTLAARLGWKLWDLLLTEEIARLAHSNQADVQHREERRDPLYYRLLKSFALGSYEGSRGTPVDTLDADSIVTLSERVVLEAAAAGNCVIVGRGSQHYLQNRSDTLRFFLYASRGAKIRRLVLEGNTEANAVTLADTIDNERAAFIKNYFHVEWPNRSLYHAMINTDIGEEMVIRTILSFFRANKAN